MNKSLSSRISLLDRKFKHSYFVSKTGPLFSVSSANLLVMCIVTVNGDRGDSVQELGDN